MLFFGLILVCFIHTVSATTLTTAGITMANPLMQISRENGQDVMFLYNANKFYRGVLTLGGTTTFSWVAFDGTTTGQLGSGTSCSLKSAKGMWVVPRCPGPDGPPHSMLIVDATDYMVVSLSIADGTYTVTSIVGSKGAFGTADGNGASATMTTPSKISGAGNVADANLHAWFIEESTKQLRRIQPVSQGSPSSVWQTGPSNDRIGVDGGSGASTAGAVSSLVLDKPRAVAVTDSGQTVFVITGSTNNFVVKIYDATQLGSAMASVSSHALSSTTHSLHLHPASTDSNWVLVWVNGVSSSTIKKMDNDITTQSSVIGVTTWTGLFGSVLRDGTVFVSHGSASTVDYVTGGATISGATSSPQGSVSGVCPTPAPTFAPTTPPPTTLAPTAAPTAAPTTAAPVVTSTAPAAVAATTLAPTTTTTTEAPLGKGSNAVNTSAASSTNDEPEQLNSGEIAVIAAVSCLVVFVIVAVIIYKVVRKRRIEEEIALRQAEEEKAKSAVPKAEEMDEVSQYYAKMWGVKRKDKGPKELQEPESSPVNIKDAGLMSMGDERGDDMMMEDL